MYEFYHVDWQPKNVYVYALYRCARIFGINIKNIKQAKALAAHLKEKHLFQSLACRQLRPSNIEIVFIAQQFIVVRAAGQSSTRARSARKIVTNKTSASVARILLGTAKTIYSIQFFLPSFCYLLCLTNKFN